MGKFVPLVMIPEISPVINMLENKCRENACEDISGLVLLQP